MSFFVRLTLAVLFLLAAPPLAAVSCFVAVLGIGFRMVWTVLRYPRAKPKFYAGGLVTPPPFTQSSTSNWEAGLHPPEDSWNLPTPASPDAQP